MVLENGRPNKNYYKLASGYPVDARGIVINDAKSIVDNNHWPHAGKVWHAIPTKPGVIEK